MNQTRSLLPALRPPPPPRHLPSLSSFTHSTPKFILKNVQHHPLFDDCPTQPDQEDRRNFYHKEKRSRHKQFNSYVTLGSFGRNEELLTQAKLINNKYFPLGHRLSTQKENVPAAVSLKRYRSFRNKWFNESEKQAL